MTKLAAILLAALALSANAEPAPRELHYSARLCAQQFNGQPGTLPSGLRPDCITEFAVIEFDWAKSPKHYECIGQAIVYAAETGKLPVCVLLARDEQEHAFAIAQRQAMHRAGVALRVIRIEGAQ